MNPLEVIDSIELETGGYMMYHYWEKTLIDGRLVRVYIREHT